MAWWQDSEAGSQQGREGHIGRYELENALRAYRKASQGSALSEGGFEGFSQREIGPETLAGGGWEASSPPLRPIATAPPGTSGSPVTPKAPAFLGLMGKPPGTPSEPRRGRAEAARHTPLPERPEP